MLLVLLEVVIRAVGHAPQLAPAEGEQILKVRGGLGIEGQLLRVVVAQAQVLFLHAQGEQPVAAEAAPIGKPFQIFARAGEEFQLHLLEFARAEGEVAGRDLVAEGFADLADARGQLFARGAHHVFEIDEDALRGLRAQVQLGSAVLRHALEGFEHHVELANAGEILFAAHRAGNAVLGDVGFHLFVAPAVGLHFFTVRGAEILNQLVRAETSLASLAIHQRIVEAAHMPGSHPHFAVHQNRAVHARVVGIFLHEFAPPGALDVVFEFHAQRAIIPGVGQAAVNFGACEDEAPVFAQGDEFVHRERSHTSASIIRKIFSYHSRNREFSQGKCVKFSQMADKFARRGE